MQRLTGTGGCSRYVQKYIGNIHKQNYIDVEENGKGKATTKAYHLHNAKVTLLEMGEDKDKKKRLWENSRTYYCSHTTVAWHVEIF